MFPFEDPSSPWVMIANQLIFMVPEILIQILGMILALVFIRGRLGPAICLLIALGASLVFGVGGVVSRQLIMHRVYMGETDYVLVQPYIIAISSLQALVYACSLVLFIIAALAWRPRAQAPS